MPRPHDRLASSRALRPAPRSIAAPVLRIQRPAHERASGRYAGLGAAGERGAARGAQLQAASAARHFFLRRRGTQRSCRLGRWRHPYAQHARHLGGVARRSHRRQRQLLAERRLRCRCGHRAGWLRCCRRAFTTRHSSGRIGMCSSPRFAAWRVSAVPPENPIPIDTRKRRRKPRSWWWAAGSPALSAAVSAAEAGADTLLLGERPRARRCAGVARGCAGCRARSARRALRRAPHAAHHGVRYLRSQSGMRARSPAARRPPRRVAAACCASGCGKFARAP